MLYGIGVSLFANLANILPKNKNLQTRTRLSELEFSVFRIFEIADPVLIDAKTCKELLSVLKDLLRKLLKHTKGRPRNKIFISMPSFWDVFVVPD